MKALYASKKEPKKIFGEDTPELKAFNLALWELCPGACQLLEDLVSSWQPYALAHRWPLPDGYKAVVKVMVEKEARVEVDELNHSKFTYTWYENEGEQRDVKNGANIVHSVDAYILRSIVRRCNYDRDVAVVAMENVQDTLLSQQLQNVTLHSAPSEDLEYYKERYESTKMADIVILPHLTWNNCQHLSTEHLQALRIILSSMLEHKPFEVVTIHDDFKCHANNMNFLRKHYRNLLAELADAVVLDDIFTHIYNSPCTYTKLTSDLSTKIRKANYHLS